MPRRALSQVSIVELNRDGIPLVDFLVDSVALSNPWYILFPRATNVPVRLSHSALKKCIKKTPLKKFNP